MLYATAYFFRGQLVDMNLFYPENLIVMFAGVLGPIAPTAPSGIGIFSASAIASFLILGRSLAKSFLLGIVFHLLFSIAVKLPALSVYCYLHLKQPRIHSTEKHA
jgi:hypothetical protein